jgi:L-lactate dehydrogenase complex protein LldE
VPRLVTGLSFRPLRAERSALNMLKVGLFVPCYVNELFPQVALATLELLEACGVAPVYPLAQSCCGQPLTNNGDAVGARAAAEHFIEVFKDFDYVVAPSASCVSQVRHRFPWVVDDDDFRRLAPRVYEIVEFLQDVLQLERLPRAVHFPHKVSIHQSCHGLRELQHASASELMIPWHSRLERILRLVDGIELSVPARRDECCGFGGTFSVDEADVSLAMGRDCLVRHAATGAEYIVGADSSCLMHLGGIGRHQGNVIRPVHVVEILSGRAR